MLRSLAGIDRLQSTFGLSVVWANGIEDIGPICRMRWLNRLSLSDLPQLRTIDGIEALENLSEPHLSGNLGALHPPLRLDSVKAISKLAALEKLEFLNIRLENDDISFVASSFPKLRNLTLSNEFERVQFAFLAKRLNAQLAEPIAAYAKLNVSCPKCGGELFRFTGRRMPTLCSACERDRFDRLLQQFEDLLQSS